jgi:hypothetical protein
VFRLMFFLLLAVASVGNCAEPLLYRFDLTIDLNAEDPVHFSAVIPGGESRVLPVNSDLQFEITAPRDEGMATTVRLVRTTVLTRKVLHTAERDWPASVERESTYQICDGNVIEVISKKRNKSSGKLDISLEHIAPETAKCRDYGLSRDTRPPAEWRTLSDLSGFLVNVRSAQTVAVYEGLPHQSFENDVYLSELQRADVVRIETFPFYEAPLNVSPAEKLKLTEIVLGDDAHIHYRGPKMCGGYHPDYVLIWDHAGVKSGAMVCFGCHEVIYFSAQGRLIQELGDAAYGSLKAVLSRYRVNRPTALHGSESLWPATSGHVVGGIAGVKAAVGKVTAAPSLASAGNVCRFAGATEPGASFAR